nr:hypothetical protein [Angustibacter aerolatus]
MLETVRECLQDVFDVPGLVEPHARPAGPPGAAGRGRDAAPVAVRPQPAVRVRRAVPVRGRLTAGRTPRRRAGPRSDAAVRACWAARARPCASLLDPEAVERTEQEPAAPGRDPPHPRRRGRRRPAARAGSAVDGRGRRAVAAPRVGGRVADRARAGPPGDRRPHRR